MALSKVVPKETSGRLNTLLAQKPKLQIVRGDLKPTDSLVISNLMEDGLTKARTIGKRINGKNYLYDVPEATRRANAIVKKTGMSIRDAVVKVYENPPLLGEIPKDYPENYHIDENGIIGTRETLIPGDSKDKFHISYDNPALAGKGKIEVNLEINNPNNPKSHYKESVKVTLYEHPEFPGLFHSAPLLLVASPKFDQHNAGSKDNSSQDQTFLAEPGSEISVSYEDKILGEISRSSASVPVNKTLEVPIYILKDEDGNPMATQEQVNRQIELLQESLAPAGIKVIAQKPVYIDLPQGVSLKNGVQTASPNSEIAEDLLITKAIANAYPHNPGVRLIFAGNNIEGIYKGEVKKANGHSITERMLPPDLKYAANSVFLKSEAEPPETAGHEVLHCLLFSSPNLKESGYYDRAGHYLPNPSNIMYQGDKSAEAETLFGRRHMSDAQIETALQSTRLKNPPIIRHQIIEHQNGAAFVPGP
jgi:hypothetical protein